MDFKKKAIAALEELKGDCTGVIAATIEDCQKVIGDIPEDAAEVVRCKDCKHFGKCSIYDIGNFYRYDFCSYGERKE